MTAAKKPTISPDISSITMIVVKSAMPDSSRRTGHRRLHKSLLFRHMPNLVYRSTNARLRKLTSVDSELRKNCPEVCDTIGDRPVRMAFTLRI